MASFSYKTVGKVEDITDFVINLSPDETLLTSKFGRTSIIGTEHSWLSDSLRPAQENKTTEKVDFATIEATPRKRQSNYVQQFMHGYNVTDIGQAIKKYGVKDEMGYQMVKASKEIGRDLEYAVATNATNTMLDDATPGRMGGVPYFLAASKTFTVVAGTDVFTIAGHKLVNGDIVSFYKTGAGVIPAGLLPNKQYFVHVVDKDTFTVHLTSQDAQGNVNKVDVTSTGTAPFFLTEQNLIDAGSVAPPNAGKFTFDLLNDAMQAAWTRGGKIDSAIMSGRNKRKASSFTQGTQKTKDMTSREVVEVIDVIETDFGRINLIAHRMYANDVVDLLEFQYWKLGYLIPFHVEDVQRKGTYKEKVITGVATLECTAPIANARIFGITG